MNLMRPATMLLWCRCAASTFMTSPLGTRTICVMGAKSFAASKGILANSQ